MLTQGLTPQRRCSMNETPKSQSPNGLLSNEATRVRWDWVHRAITLAKSRNAELLLASETGEYAARLVRPVED